ncbi:hypothetical protein OSX66_12785 [Staphylococcus agnetis]|uniref:hypothetical protein n=1 Tax=Staphylococcus agnetis TaxID=985762 RepID=UPI00241814FA|nr:hypothetical protein [Staphylococcus agnetis]MDG4944727.1 hypothetical protein [Staphylococcus agnetis]
MIEDIYEEFEPKHSDEYVKVPVYTAEQLSYRIKNGLTITDKEHEKYYNDKESH